MKKFAVAVTAVAVVAAVVAATMSQPEIEISSSQSSCVVATMTNLYFFAEEINGSVVATGYYDPKTGITVHFDKPVYNAEVEMMYRLQCGG